MTLQTALVGLGVTSNELLLGLMRIAPEGKLDQGMTPTIKALVPAATESRVGSIIKALKAEEYATNLNGQGPNPKWVLHLEKFPEPALTEPTPELDLAGRLKAMAGESEERAAEGTRRAQLYADAASIIEHFGGDTDRAMAAAQALIQNAV